ncbi:MAG TPA: MFS transporter [Caulobacteraceae bacterium]|nr:MFS transporter [Caulobacteraceae bacterium]
MEQPVDVAALIDRSPFGTYQKLILAVAALCVIADGLDSQLIGFAVPLMLKEWGRSREAFAPVLAAGLLGMAIGSACGGLIADRIGRRAAIIASLVVFGVGTIGVGFAPGLSAVALLRFLAGLGIGGALPSVSTFTAEFTPARSRTLVVTSSIVCVPLGGMVAGLIAGVVLPHLGWRPLFWIGGTAPLVLAAILLAVLPETPKFLARADRQQPLVKLLARMGFAVQPGVRYVEASDPHPGGHKGVRRLFQGGLALDTLLLWAAFFSCLLAIYGVFSWLPTVLGAAGWSLGTATAGLTAYNLGGVVGAVACAAVIGRFGSRWPMLICCAGAIASAIALRFTGPDGGAAAMLLGVAVHGFCVNAVQSTMYALCAHIYPTVVRATGTAAALTIGRLGSILSAFGGAAVMSYGGVPGYLAMLAAAMSVTFIALALLRGHIPQRVGLVQAVEAT